MKYIVAFVIAVVAGLFMKAEATECRKYTPEQHNVLAMAYSVGKPYDMSYTLMAIARQESFVGGYVVRVNGKDGSEGSYGVMHINLTTAMYLEGIDNVWQAKAKLAPRLMVDDLYAMNLALRKLETNANLGWSDMVRSYNGNVRSQATLNYLNSIKTHIKEFQKCKVF